MMSNRSVAFGIALTLSCNPAPTKEAAPSSSSRDGVKKALRDCCQDRTSLGESHCLALKDSVLSDPQLARDGFVWTEAQCYLQLGDLVEPVLSQSRTLPRETLLLGLLHANRVPPTVSLTQSLIQISKTREEVIALQAIGVVSRYGEKELQVLPGMIASSDVKERAVGLEIGMAATRFPLDLPAFEHELAVLAPHDAKATVVLRRYRENLAHDADVDALLTEHGAENVARVFGTRTALCSSTKGPSILKRLSDGSDSLVAFVARWSISRRDVMCSPK